ncbi:MAG: hypothetical protein GY852_02145 [bacterium]|nr:hypothetical protein [bacterium]
MKYLGMIKVFCLVILLIVAGILIFRMQFVEYVPVVLSIERGDHILKEDHSLISPEHIESMRATLNNHGEGYKVKDGKLFIRRALQKDYDLLQNYTSKAEILRETGVSFPIVIAIPVAPSERAPKQLIY